MFEGAATSGKVTPTATMHVPSVESMQDRLDLLWEKHLLLLDQYDQAQKQLQKHMSSGFFSLAQASFKSPSRIRYGQDYYDERMQASRKSHVEMDGEAWTRVSVRGVENQETKHVEKQATEHVPNNDSSVDDAKADVQMPTPPATPLHEADGPDTQSHANSNVASNKEPTSHKNYENHTEDKPKKLSDPLHWYGILVPPQLRQSQQSFIHAIDGPLSDAANAAQGLRRIEVDIRRLRKDIKKAEKTNALEKEAPVS